MKEYASSPWRHQYCLNGIWDFSIASDSIDRLPAVWEDMGIKVPSPFNVNSFMQSYHRHFCGEEAYVQGGDFRLYPEYPAAWERATCGFYRRSVQIAEASRGHRIFLRFDAVAFHCAFYINGVRLAETMEAFLPIELEITDHVKYGEDNEIIVACETAHHLIYKGKDGRNRLDYPQGSFWGSHIAGIWCDAWLIERPMAYVDDIFAVTDVDTRTLRVQYRSAHAAGASVRFTLKKWNTDEAPRVIASADQATGEVVWQWQDGEVELWDFLQPNLYELTVQLLDSGKVMDEKTVRIGFRTMRAEGEKFVLNGRRINLKIDAWHYLGYTIQTPEYARAYYQMALDAGVNIIRLHAEPFPEFFIDIADEMGMLIVSESAVWASHCMFSYSPDFFKNSQEHLVRMLLRDRNHPSVVMWSPENECIPAYMFCGSDYVKSIPELEECVYDFLKIIEEYDTSRLVSCDGSGDLGGRLPVNSLHYPHYDCPTHRGKPITIGEMGSMYYSTPDTVSREYGPRTLECFDGRLESVASEAHYDLIGERKWASQICVFNLIWYGLRPLPFTDRALTWDDYTTPGIKPSRITPYMRTLNADAQDDLPAYLPNAVWTQTQDAYIPARSFAERLPERIAVGKEQTFHITTFNDLREDADFTLSVALGEEVQTLQFSIASCEYREDEVTFVAPAAGETTLTLSLAKDGEVLHTCSYPVEVIDMAAMAAELAALGVAVIKEGELPTDVPVIDCRGAKPYGEFVRPVRQQHFFVKGEKIGYPMPVESGVFEDCLSFGATPVMTDGAGNAIALDLSCVGERRIVSALDLTGDDPTTATIRLELARHIAAANVVVPSKPYYLGDASAPCAAMLSELGCEYDMVQKEDMPALLRRKSDRLLIIDGSAEYDALEHISANNFARVLLVSPKKSPKLFTNELRISERKLFHLIAKNGADVMTGLTSNALYGLEANREQILANGCMEHRLPSKDILLGAPDVDWRLWNNNAEPLKTVAIMRSEMRDESRISALSVRRYAGSAFYLTTLACDIDSPKQKNIWARLLSHLGVAMEMRRNDETANLLRAGLYASHVRRMLVKTVADGEEIAAVKPCLNAVEGGSAWRISRGRPMENALYALYVTSPQDRRDLLLNPDYIDLHVASEKEVAIYLNGACVGKGCEFDVTGLPLIGGVNLLLCHVQGKAAMPQISFKRAKNMPLDLGFALSAAVLQPISMEGVTYKASVNDFYSSHASFTREHFWSTNQHQEPGITLNFTFPQEICMRAMWFVAIKFHNEGEDLTPRAFRLLAGEDEAHMHEVYATLSEKQMSYPRGRVYIELPQEIRAKCFAIELTEAAPKELVISDLTLLG
jgi:hypothetical protein